jgi:hypothetical protein
MRKLFGHFKAPDNISVGVLWRFTHQMPEPAVSDGSLSNQSRLTTSDINDPHVIITHGLEGRIDRSEVVFAALNEVESSVLDVQSLPVSMSRLGRPMTRHLLQLQHHLFCQLIHVIHQKITDRQGAISHESVCRSQISIPDLPSIRLFIS